MVEKIESIVKELRERGVIYCESISQDEWKRRGWPEDVSFFRLIDAHLNLYRRTDEYLRELSSYEYRLIIR